MGSDSKMTILAEKRAQQNRNTPAYKRLEKLFDAGSFTEMDAFAKADETAAGVVAGYGAIEGSTVFAGQHGGRRSRWQGACRENPQGV